MSKAVTLLEQLAVVNEKTWLQVGKLAELMNNPERAVAAYESAIIHNPTSDALLACAILSKDLSRYKKAVDLFTRFLKTQDKHGEAWGLLGHCYLMLDELQKAYHAYQQALLHIPNPKDPKLWYGIAVLYDRYGSFDHAQEALSAVLRMDPNFDNISDVHLRLACIYRSQNKFNDSLDSFQKALQSLSPDSSPSLVLIELAALHELQQDWEAARDAYQKIITAVPNHQKALAKLGWLYHLQSTPFCNLETGLDLVKRSLDCDPTDLVTLYIIGRCYMLHNLHTKAYEAYQQCVYPLII
jgi:tetratricopeptide (TPR) repeat protein